MQSSNGSSAHFGGPSFNGKGGYNVQANAAASQRRSSWEDGKNSYPPNSSSWSQTESPHGDGRQFAAGAEVRTVPSVAFPTIASALAQPGPASLPTIVVRVLPGVYRENLFIRIAVVIIGTGDGLPTICPTGPEGLRIAGSDQCMLRRLRICAEQGGHALSIYEASPLIESCELLGAGGDPTQGTPPAGLDIRGTSARPIVRGCRISGHPGAGASFSSGACGLLAGCDISRCGCGIWVDQGADPLLWKNAITGHRGAGIVVRADGAGTIMGNTVIRNGAGGILMESCRKNRTVIAQNRVWANTGLDMRQSVANQGLAASEDGVLLLGNTVGEQDPGPDVNPNTVLTAQWPSRMVVDAEELVAAVREAPRDRAVLIELVGRIDLQETLVVDRPVVLASRERGGAELHGADGADAVILIARGGETSGLWWLTLKLGSRLRTGASCVDVTAGRPAIIECDFDASVNDESLSRERGALTTYGLRSMGSGTAPVLAGCVLRGATGNGIMLDTGGSALLIQTEITRNQQGGLYMGEGASLTMEGCEIRGNGHFGVTISPQAHRAYLGRATLSDNLGGSVWACAGADRQPLILDQCFLGNGGGLRRGSGSNNAAPAVVVGQGASSIIWESSFTNQQRCEAAIRGEAGSGIVVAVDGSIPGWPGWSQPLKGYGNTQVPERMIVGNGRAVCLDVSGAAPPQQAPPPSPMPMQSSPLALSLSPNLPSSMPLPPRLFEDDDIRRMVAQEAAAAVSVYRSLPPSPLPSNQSMPPSPLPSTAQRSPTMQQRVPVSWPQASPKLGHRNSPPPQYLQAQMGKGGRLPGSSPSLEIARPKSMPLSPMPPGPEPLQRAQTAPGGHVRDEPDKSVRFKSSDSLHSYNPRHSPSMMSAEEEWEAVLAAMASGETEAPKDSSPFPLPAPPTSSKSVPRANQMEPQIGPDGEDKHAAWLRSKVSAKSQDLPSTEANRQTLWELLSMLCAKSRCEDVLDKVGLGGAIKPGDTVYIRGHTGLWLGVKNQSEVLCNKDNRGSALGLVVDAKVEALRHGSRIALRVGEGGRSKLGVAMTGEARIIAGGKADMETQFTVQSLNDHSGTILSGMPVVLRSAGLNKNLDIEGETVRARSTDTGTLQKLVLEKIPPESEIPLMASDRELSIPEQAWVLRRGVNFALVDKQALAKYISGHKKERKELLRAYTFIWEEEWRNNRLAFTGDGDDQKSTVSGASMSTAASRRATSRGRSTTMDKFFGMFTGVSDEDKANGDMFSDALRSFFATALRMSQLEADCVQRVIEAFAAALVQDTSFLKAFTASMLPEKERKTYRTPEEVLFGLAYTTMMLNTDAHNQQVTQKLWDTKKFVGAGKDCGVTSGLMMQIFKNVNKEEL